MNVTLIASAIAAFGLTLGSQAGTAGSVDTGDRTPAIGFNYYDLLVEDLPDWVAYPGAKPYPVLVIEGWLLGGEPSPPTDLDLPVSDGQNDGVHLPINSFASDPIAIDIGYPVDHLWAAEGAHVIMMPEPSSVALVFLGAVAFVSRRKH